MLDGANLTIEMARVGLIVSDDSDTLGSLGLAIDTVASRPVISLPAWEPGGTNAFLISLPFYYALR